MRWYDWLAVGISGWCLISFVLALAVTRLLALVASEGCEVLEGRRSFAFAAATVGAPSRDDEYSPVASVAG
jgi:hypothetical protein